MISLLESWKGSINIEQGRKSFAYDSADELLTAHIERKGPIIIDLHPKQIKSQNKANTSDIQEDEVKEVIITVKGYMTKKATPEFDFMSKWNNDNPMPLRTMVGHKVKETRGMVYMQLHGDILQQVTHRCLKCGKVLTNKVSQYFGIGPECGNHNYVNPFDTDKELKQAVEDYKLKLQNITWEGWIIKSAITDIKER